MTKKKKVIVVRSVLCVFYPTYLTAAFLFLRRGDIGDAAPNQITHD